MAKKFEFTEQQIEGYKNLLKSKISKYESEKKAVQAKIDRLQAKIDSPEANLRKDLREGLDSVFKATGIQKGATKRAASSTVPAAPVASEKIEIPTREMKLEEPTKKKSSGWEDWT